MAQKKPEKSPEKEHPTPKRETSLLPPGTDPPPPPPQGVAYMAEDLHASR